MISFQFIASGSKGNATLLYDGETLIQIDMGIPLKRLKEGLSNLHKDVKDIQGVFLTHEHADHISKLPLLQKRGVKVYASLGVCPETDVFLTPGEEIKVGSIAVLPFSSSHDARNPLNYVFESNHDKTMLLSSSRPIQLKKRILGKKGHLSNEQAGEYLSSLIGPKTKKIYLAHLSEECNTPEIALETIHRVFQKNGISFPIEDVVPLKQHRLIEGGEE